MKNYILIIVALLAFCLNVGAQEKQKGRVVDAQTQEPLAGAIVKVLEPAQTVTTNNEGYFELSLKKGKYQFQIQYLGYGVRDTTLSVPSSIRISLRANSSQLNEVQITGYGQTTKRLATGSISSINAAELERQPITNVLSALAGRMPGVIVQTTNGLPGGNINVQIRGRGSIGAGTAPLYIIDGVPFDGEAPNAANSQIGYNSINGAISPLNNLNPTDIEQISVLKDADATSIYGSRGSNGVVIITTKLAQAKVLNFSVNYKNGNSVAAQLPQLMPLAAYLSMRKEAFANAGQVPSNNPSSANYAPDLTIWSQTEGQNWAEYMLGNTAKMQNLQFTLSNAQGQSSFQMSANYHQEGSILLGNDKYDRASLMSNYQLNKDKFQLTFRFQLNNQQANYSNLANSSAYLLAPNYPLSLTDGSYNWYGGNNLLAEANARSKNETLGLISNLSLKKQLHPLLSANLNFGLSSTAYQSILLYPLKALKPNSTNYTQNSNNNNQSLIIEPQLNFKKRVGKNQFELLWGGTYQVNHKTYQYLKGSNYSLEALMEDWAAAAIIDNRNSQDNTYKYLSVFGRFSYSFNHNIIFNATLRRDGSSRFGPENRFGNFWSVAGSWLWQQNAWVKRNLNWLSHGKIRTSIGTTGNDQIGDDQYLSTYSSSGSNVYQGQSTLKPSRIANENFRWETTLKKDIALELGALNDRIFFALNYYRNISKDQLVAQVLPQLTGFTSYQSNIPAKVLNQGWEWVAQLQLLQKKNWQLSMNFNYTKAENKLLTFENLASSTYANLYKIGEDISRVNGYQWLGINPTTGQQQYADINGQPSSTPYTYYTLGSTSPEQFGGIGLQVAYKQFEFAAFAQGVKQMGWGHAMYNYPGTGIFNGYALMENRWSANNLDAVYPAAKINTYDINFPTSSANFFDTSFIRIKSLSAAFNFPSKWLKKLNMKGFRLTTEAQNPFSFWNKKLPIFDPESGVLSAGISRNLPPLKTLVFAAQLKF